jgi:hypothetical protein
MNTRTNYKSMEKTIQFVFILLAVLVLSSCSPKDQVNNSSCTINMGMRVTIDVTDAKPQVVFDQLARELDCAISISPFVWKHVTLQVENATISEVLDRVCSQIGCKYILNENHLAIKPLTIIDKMRAKQWEEFNRMMEERNRKLQSLLPEGMTFEDAPLSSVLKEISKVSGLDIKPWKDEGDRKVTIDVSGMTVEEALKTVVLYVDGEGAVLIRQEYFLHHSWGQDWLWGYPPSF